MTNTGASSFRWFRDELCSMEVATAKLMHIDPYNVITATAQNSKPGANGVTALTCFQGSHTRIKNEKARGAFFGINLGTTKADLAQAILEGICYEMKDILKMNEALYGKEAKIIRLCGGVAKSPYWCQMFADVFEKPIELTEVTELGCLGAAMCAGIGAGLFKDTTDAVKKCVHVKETYTPNPEAAAVYREGFDKWFECLKVVNAEIYK
jgi:xylulokinase